MSAQYIVDTITISSLGFDPRNTFAAVRAGIRRPQILENFPYKNSETGDMSFAKGFCVPFLTQGFEGQGRIIALLDKALLELKEKNYFPMLQQQRLGIFIGLPHQHRRYTGKELTISDDLKEEFEEYEAEFSLVNDPYNSEQIFESACKLSGFSITPLVLEFNYEGNTSMQSLLSLATQLLNEDKIDTALIGGIDSYISEPTLKWLHATGRLKTEDNPTGIQPGEAAAFVLLSNKLDQFNERELFLQLNQLSFASEQDTRFSNQLSFGNALTEVIYNTTANILEQESTFWVIGDQSGEQYRAMEWGHTTVKLIQKNEKYRSIDYWPLPIALGDTGAATGPLSLAYALEAYTRRYAPNPYVCIVAGSDNHERAALTAFPVIR